MAGYYGRMSEVFSQTPGGEVMLSSEQKGCLQEIVAGGKQRLVSRPLSSEISESG